MSVLVAPEDGKANAAVIALLAKTLRTPKSSLFIQCGQSSRNKSVRVVGLTEAHMRERLRSVLPLGARAFSEPEA